MVDENSLWKKELLMTYTFQSNKGIVTVEANNEDHARSLAMTKVYGPSTYGHEYRGLGLVLLTST